jgi:hypothetical protein
MLGQTPSKKVCLIEKGLDLKDWTEWKTGFAAQLEMLQMEMRQIQNAQDAYENIDRRYYNRKLEDIHQTIWNNHYHLVQKLKEKGIDIN